MRKNHSLENPITTVLFSYTPEGVVTTYIMEGRQLLPTEHLDTKGGCTVGAICIHPKPGEDVSYGHWQKEEVARIQVGRLPYDALSVACGKVRFLRPETA